MIRPQYHGRHTPEGFLVWDVSRLLKLAQPLPVQEIALSQIAEFDENYWYQSSDTVPTGRSIADHIRLVNEARLDYPIVLCAAGRLMDGMHRVIKAHVDGHITITAVRFHETPEPDYRDIDLADLPYEEE